MLQIARLQLALLLLILFVQFSSPRLHAVDDEKAKLEFFENQIRPLLSKNCFACHGPKKQKSNLRLDSKQAMIDGGDSGGVLEPGHPDESLLLEVLTREEDQMPPGKRLAPREIKAVERWIKLGAPWPEGSPTRASSTFTDKDKNYWAFQRPVFVKPSRSSIDKWSTNEIDFRVWQVFKDAGQKPEKIASKRALLRRVFFDVVGLPPTIEEQNQFLNDKSPGAYERLVDRLLADSRYGEKWARHWLDLVRYAESDGYKQDDYRPNAWRYRDYVIKSFNDDKPYDQFVLEQLAGDEIDPGNPEFRIATGFLRHWIYEYNQRDVRTQWDTILNDVTSVTGDVFLGVSMNCARCHDHKFDPILQKDFFRLKAFFAPLMPRDDVMLANPEELQKHKKAQDRWLEATARIRDEIDQLEFVHHQRKMNPEIKKFPLDIRPMMLKSRIVRSPFEHQLASLAFRQVKKLTEKELETKIKGKEKLRWLELRKELKKLDPVKPAKLPLVMTVSDVGENAPPTLIPDDSTRENVQPGVLSILDSAPLEIEKPAGIKSTGRRLALARWLVDESNPITARVIVNRIWQYHFGQGIVKSTSDFGRLGQPPVDLQLLDYLASRFVKRGWRFKALHRDILLSSTYRQAATKQVSAKLRPFQQIVRRLDAEQIRDAMLSVSGELDSKKSGPSAEASSKSRTVFVKVIRNRRDPLLDVFDAPDNFNSTSGRNVTTTPTQSLLMINGKWTLERAKSMAARFSVNKSAAAVIEQLFLAVYGRLPNSSEKSDALDFIEANSQKQKLDQSLLIDLCHAMLNSNEFIYID